MRRFRYITAENDYTADLDYTAWTSALVGGSILRRSDSPSTPVNRSLPRNGAPGSLGHESAITIDTSRPQVVAVLSSLSADIYRRRTATQSLEISWMHWRTSFSTLHSGAFRLSYGPSTTNCIKANATAHDVQSALAGLLSVDNLTLAVTEVAAPHENARRFAIDFDAMGASTSIQNIRVDVSDPSCEPWKCSLTLGGKSGPCEAVAADVVEFRAAGYEAWAGFIDVTLRFSAPVIVSSDGLSAPHIGLNIVNGILGGSAYSPNATFTEGSLVQFIDVGVFASEPLDGGQFRLRYGKSGPTTGCIDYDAAVSPVMAAATYAPAELTSGGARNMRIQLEALQPIAAIGLKSVTVRQWGNGSRFMVQFNEGSNPLRLEPTNRSDCRAFEPPEDAEVTLPPSTDLTFRYAVQNGDMALPHLTLTSRDAETSHVAAIHLNGSSILRDATFPTTKALLSLPTNKVTPCSWGHAALGDGCHCRPTAGKIVIDSSAIPQVVNITTSTWSDEYGVNEWVDFFVKFTGPVIADEGTLLLLRTGNRVAEGAAILRPSDEVIKPGFRPFPLEKFGNETSILRFQYRIREGDGTLNLIPRTGAAIIGTVKSALFTQSVLAFTTLPFQNMSNEASRNYTVAVDKGNLKVNTERPYIVNVFIDKLNGTYTVGEDIFIQVVFSKPVSTKGPVILSLNSGGTAELQRNAGNKQVFDVGVDVKSELRHGCCGDFQLFYKSHSSGCIPWDNSSALESAVHNFSSLQKIDGLLNDWRHSLEIKSHDYHGGFRWKIHFLKGGQDSRQYPSALKPLLAEASACPEAVDAATAETNILAFIYTIEDGDMAEVLDVSGPNALQLLPMADIECEETVENRAGEDTAYIRRAATRALQDANLTIPSNLLTANPVRVNTSAPRVTSIVSVSGDGPFSEGDTIVFRVRFSAVVHLLDKNGREVTSLDWSSEEAVALSANDQCSQNTYGNPALSLALDTRRSLNGTFDASQLWESTNITKILSNDSLGYDFASTARARYVNGSGSADLYLQYIVRPLESASNLDYANGTALHMQQGFVLLADSTNPRKPASLALPRPGMAGSLSYQQNVTILAKARDPTRVRVITANVFEGCYYPGHLINIQVIFTRCVDTPAALGPGKKIVLSLNTALPGQPERQLEAITDRQGRRHARMLVFPWLVGANDRALRVETLPGSFQIIDDNDYALLHNGTSNADDLHDNRGFVVNMRIPMPGTEGALDSSVVLATHHGSSRLRAMDPLLSKTTSPPRALRTSTNISGVTRTAGDAVFITVHFDKPVAVHCTALSLTRNDEGEQCPSLVLQTKEGTIAPQQDHEWANWTSMARAVYYEGNKSSTIVFR